jgi:hypothetical protein
MGNGLKTQTLEFQFPKNYTVPEEMKDANAEDVAWIIYTGCRMFRQMSYDNVAINDYTASQKTEELIKRVQKEENRKFGRIEYNLKLEISELKRVNRDMNTQMTKQCNDFKESLDTNTKFLRQICISYVSKNLKLKTTAKSNMNSSTNKKKLKNVVKCTETKEDDKESEEESEEEESEEESEDESESEFESASE